MKLVIEQSITNLDVTLVKQYEFMIADFDLQLDAIEKSVLLDKGYLIVASAASTPGALPPGVTGQLLKANSAAGLGVEWADHDKAGHDALGIDADTVDGSHASAFATSGHNHDADYVNEVDHTKAAHDALNIDADTVDGSHASAFATSGHTHALGDLSNVTATGEGSGGGFDADTVDGKHATSFISAAATAILGNKDIVLESGEIALVYIPFSGTLKEIYIWEAEGLSGSATITLYRATSLGGSWVSQQDCSLSAAATRSITGLSIALAKGYWLKLQTSGTPTTVKRVCVGLYMERS